MTGAIKISAVSTISYDTFSCTLEGFDDPSDVMKAIVAYFHDLAADRGDTDGEPRMPDVDVLTMLAEREIGEGVDVEINDNSIVLHPVVPTADLDAAIAPLPFDAPADEYDDMQDDAVTGISDDADAPGHSDEQLADEVPPEDEGDEENAEAAEEDADLEVTAADEDSTESTTPDDEAVESDVLATDDTSEEEDAQTETVDATEDAADLEVTAADEDSSESTTPDDEAVESDVLLADEASEDDNAQTETVDAAEEDTDLEVIVEDEDSSESTTPDDETVEGDVLATDEASEDDDALTEATEKDIVDADEAGSEDEPADLDDTAEDVADAPNEEEAPDDALDQESADNDGMNETSENVVLREHAEDTQDTDAEADIDVDVEESTVSPENFNIQKDVLFALGETSLSAEDEADLVAELADVEVAEPVSEYVLLEENSDIDRGIGKTLRLDRASRALHEEGGAKDEDSVSRLMDKAAEQLDDTEITRRRSAFSHLRAAMAATVADRKFKPETHDDTFGDTDDAKAYRTDLADAVTPVRPQDAKDDGHMDAPEPLVLASEQRLDKDEVETPEPVEAKAPEPVIAPSPQEPEAESADPPQEMAQDEVSGQDDVKSDLNGTEQPVDLEDDGNDTGFAAFAKKMDATELIDLLEAAAAYTTYIEGHTEFVRPQIMRQVSELVGTSGFGREEGLLTFGQLLRQGKIVKASPGRFKVADTTRFKPDAGS